ESDARNYLDEHGYTFPVTMETPELLEVFGKRRVIPMVFVITPDGKVAEAIPGEMFEEDVLELINYAP
ncbi:MAG TPA: TlpA family protein disulfide reductase, partial [Burkholderiaceae bacterium]|nr:TlpA family protein disulfide reductase [Burkholderiaceae bacterium]